MSINSKSLLIATIVSLLSGSLVWAHGGNSHEADLGEKNGTEEDRKVVFEKINSDYLEFVKPIFESKCFACHSKGMALPWYRHFPVISGIVDYDITEAKIHLDMTNDYPFDGHGGVEKDLAAIRETVRNGKMPPLRYRMIHWSSSLSPDEMKAVEGWLDRAAVELKLKSSNEDQGDR